jgi:hypothetical protein
MQGYGFIVCDRNLGLGDIFLHRNAIGSFKVGNRVIFSVSFNDQGKPQAFGLRPAEGPEAREQDSEDTCNVYMNVHGVDFEKLSQDEGLSSTFEAKVKEALIRVLKKAQSITVSPESILLQLKQGAEDNEPDPQIAAGRRLEGPGSILVFATVTPPAGEALAKVVSALGEAVAVSDSVATAVSGMEGIEAVSSGRISVAEVLAEAGPAPTSAPASVVPQFQPQETSASSPNGEGISKVALIVAGVLAALVGAALAVFAVRRRAAETDYAASPPKANHAARRRQEAFATGSPMRPPPAEARTPTEKRRPWAVGRRRSKPDDGDGAAAAAAAEAQYSPRGPQRSPRGQQDAWSTFSTVLATGRLTQEREPPPPPPPPPSRFGLW